MMRQNQRPNFQPAKVGNTGARGNERQNVNGGGSISSTHWAEISEREYEEKHIRAPKAQPRERCAGMFTEHCRCTNKVWKDGDVCSCDHVSILSPFSKTDIAKAIAASKQTAPRPNRSGSNTTQNEDLMPVILRLTAKVDELSQQLDRSTNKVLNKVESKGQQVCDVVTNAVRKSNDELYAGLMRDLGMTRGDEELELMESHPEDGDAGASPGALDGLEETDCV